MNILASYNWVREYLKTSATPEEFARELSLKSMSVEKMEKLAEKFDHMVVGVIKEIKAHPNANKLRIAVTDIGAQTVEIVCGGSNLEVGQRVFVALPGAQVKWHGEGDLVTLGEAEIRGVKSIGMICAPAEIGFEKLQGGEHEIWDLTNVTNAPAGTPIADALEMNDVIFDVEITTNRPDAMSIIGLAREGAAAVDGTLDFSPKLLSTYPANPLKVKIESKLCPRYMSAVVTGVKVGPSPWWLQKKLLLSGHRPINNIVDITNLVLHEFGQPLHAFDKAKIRGGELVVRVAASGEKMKALDGKEYALSKKNLVIADAEGPLAVAGVMGGEESGTTASTTEVVFEAAAFDPVSVRRTARDLNLYSDSQLVFEKGLSEEALPAALARAVELAEQIAGGTLSGVSDSRKEGEAYKPLVFKTSVKKIRERIGVEISDEQIESILTKLGFMLEKKGSTITATVPFWRDHDIEAEVDLTEEVARIYGYHNMPSRLPSLATSEATVDRSVLWTSKLKRLMAEEGYTEFFGYSFVDGKDLERYGISPKGAVKVLNPLSEELGYLRTSLMPGLLRDIERNEANFRAANVFEISAVYLPVESTDADVLPREELSLVAARYGFADAEAAFMELKGTLHAISLKTGIAFKLNRLSGDARWHETRSAEVYVDVDGTHMRVGTLGQVSHGIAQAFGVEAPVFVLELAIEQLLPKMQTALHYKPITEFPVSRRDISFTVTERTTYEDVRDALLSVSGILKEISLKDVYRGKGVDDGKKNLTLSLTFSAFDRTLTSDEVEGAMKQASDSLSAKFGAVIRG